MLSWAKLLSTRDNPTRTFLFRDLFMLMFFQHCGRTEPKLLIVAIFCSIALTVLFSLSQTLRAFSTV